MGSFVKVSNFSIQEVEELNTEMNEKVSHVHHCFKTPIKKSLNFYESKER